MHGTPLVSFQPRRVPTRRKRGGRLPAPGRHSRCSKSPPGERRGDALLGRDVALDKSGGFAVRSPRDSQESRSYSLNSKDTLQLHLSDLPELLGVHAGDKLVVLFLKRYLLEEGECSIRSHLERLTAYEQPGLVARGKPDETLCSAEVRTKGSARRIESTKDELNFRCFSDCWLFEDTSALF